MEVTKSISGKTKCLRPVIEDFEPESNYLKARYQNKDIMDHTEGPMHRKKYYQGSYISKTFLPVKGKRAHIVPLVTVFLKRFPP